MEVKVPVIGGGSESPYVTTKALSQWMEHGLGPTLHSISNSLEAMSRRLDIIEKATSRTDVYVHLDKGINIVSTD